MLRYLGYAIFALLVWNALDFLFSLPPKFAVIFVAVTVIPSILFDWFMSAISIDPKEDE